MNTHFRFLLALSALASVALFAHEKSDDKAKGCGCACGQDKEVCCCREGNSATGAHSDKAPRYPLKGVIVEVQTEQSALLVKHEDIPGLMPAMTMLFKVDSATLKAVAKGQSISATLVQREDGFWLENVKPAR